MSHNHFNQTFGGQQEFQSLGQSAVSAELPTIAAQNHYRCEIVQLVLQETGTYNDQFLRPYSTNVQNELVANQLFEIVERTNYRPTSGAFNSVAAEVLSLSPRVTANDAIVIPNGWGEKRCRFFLEVRETSLGLGNTVYRTFLQGFSDHMGVNPHSGSVDPNLRLYPNSFFRVQEYIQQTPNGPRRASRVVDSGQVVNGVLTANPNTAMPVSYMRPCDVLGGVQIQNDSNLVASDVYDLRYQNRGGVNTVYSSFSNNNPSEYLSRMLTPLAQGIYGMGEVPGHRNIVDTAVSGAIALEPSPMNSVFISTITRQLGPTGNSCFTMADLAQLDPTVGTRTQYRAVAANYQGMLSQRGMTESWDVPSQETLVATKVMNTLPGLMWENFVGMVSFSMTNDFGPCTPVFDHMQMISDAVPRGIAEHFVGQLAGQFASNITMNNNLRVRLMVNASVLSDITITVSVNGGPSTMYQAPAFSNGILNPVYTRNSQNYSTLVDSIYHISTLVDQVSRNHDVGTLGVGRIS
jgi:hypothetical protein